MKRLRAIVFDCEHPAALARWWAETLDYQVREYTPEHLEWLREAGFTGPDDDPSVVIDDPGGGTHIWFNRVPERKIVKNRVHIDVNLRSADELDVLLARGASIVRPYGAVPDEDWAVVADPEGNEFCAFPPRGTE